ncbi:MAG: hypothetical protein PF439_07910 [Helicobacteraceae bacterium]|jgi:hypothetical protein|nr:hypothetical protein [Helicobacteraceae bacterium]
MNLKFGWKTTAVLLASFVLTMGLTGCGSSDQSNPPLVSTNSVVELVSSSLQYDAAGTTISGTITTNYPTALSGVATLSGFSADLTGCSVSTVAIGTGDTITYPDNNNVISNVEITLSASCSATSVTLNATETDDNNATSAWSAITAVIASSDITSSIAVITAQDINLTQNSESRQLVLKVWDRDNAPVTSGSISVRYPSEVLNGTDVGTLNPVKTATIVDGKATFDYTGPSDLSGLVADNITSATFIFYDAANESTSASVTVNYTPDTTTPPAVLTSYTVSFVNSTGAVTTALENTEVFTLSVTDDQGNLVAGTDVNATITSNQPNLAKFLDENGTEVTSLSFVEKNPSTLRLKTYQKAGLADFGIQLQIRDVNGAVGDKNVTKMVTIFSGPATAITIHYANTELITNYMIFSENMVIRLADKWDNPVNTHPKIYVGGIAGYKGTPITPSGVGNDYLIDNTLTATMSADPLGAKLTVASGIDLSGIALDGNDILMTYGADYKFHASGKWDIDSVVGLDIFLTDTFNSTTPVGEMAFAIGRNYRNDLCTPDKYILNVDSGDGTYEVNSDGVAIVSMTYEPKAVGQTIMMNVNVLGMVNELGEEMRLGEIEQHTLRGHGMVNAGSYSVAASSSGTVVFGPIQLVDTSDFLRSARFSYLAEATGDVNATCISSSDNKADQYSTTSCQSWISCSYQAGASGGSINIKNMILGSEF